MSAVIDPETAEQIAKIDAATAGDGEESAFPDGSEDTPPEERKDLLTDTLAADDVGYVERRGKVWERLLNARIGIVEDVTVVNSDGSQSGRLVITGTRDGDVALPRIVVPADEWTAMRWLSTSGYQWRQVIPAPGRTTLDKIRACIQHDSQRREGGIVQATVYRHTGWREIDGDRVFLLAEKSIGADGVRDDITVELPAGFEGYVGTEPSAGDALAADFAIWMQLLDVATDDITAVLAMSAARAILGEIHPQDAAIYSSGFTGSFKTTLHLLALGHFGQFDRAPLNWSGTANAIEGALARTKDVIALVDDFVPSGSQYDAQRKHADLERVMRNVGNRGGRARMNQYADLRQAPAAQGLVAITGEDTSGSQSATARAIALRHDRNRVDLALLTRMQEACADGVFRRVTAAFIQYTARHWDDIEAAFEAAYDRHRDTYRGRSFGHPRTAETLAAFAASAEVWFDAFVALGAIAPQARHELVARIERGLLAAGLAQAEAVQELDPIQTFVDHLRAAVTSGRAHLADADSDSEPRQAVRFGWQSEMVRTRDGLEQVSRAKGERIGWVDYENDALYLTPASALSVVQGMGERTGRRVNLSDKTLGRRLQERGVLQTNDPTRSTSRISVAGGRQRVWHLRLSHVFPEERSTQGQVSAMPGVAKESVA
ncbi:MAG: DUF927 domain-containing protein [Thermomicrobiales bacterium]